MLSKQHWSSPSFFTGSLERYITIAIAQDQIISKSKRFLEDYWIWLLKMIPTTGKTKQYKKSHGPQGFSL